MLPVVALAAATSLACHAEEPLKAELVKTGLYLFSGGGANSLLRLNGTGLILVDGKLPGHYDSILAQVHRITKMGEVPVRVLILTDHHEDRNGNNAKFRAAGVQILAQDNVKQLLKAGVPGPTLTYTQTKTINLGGAEARLLHFGNACTSGDTVVYFPNLKVVAVGDLYTASTPQPEYAAGGSLTGWASALKQILDLDFDVAVPSNGPAVSRADVQALKSKLDNFVSRASDLVKLGVSKDGMLARLNAADPGWRFDLSGEALDRFYRELSASF
jgi:glyoxylase-like metal-dependent hydrolase (beta-lactamase superfamily II)